ncbi:MAG: ATP-dependent helicase [Myxococcales bacterium]
MDPLASVLNPQQLEAVRHGDGPLLILAGAGSGKTRVLTHRIAHLLREKLARPAEVLAVTFTNKAAGELRDRVAKLVGPEAERLWVATFHAAGARLLRREAEALSLPRTFAIYDEGDALAETKRACQDLGVDVGTARQHLSRIDRWKNLGVLPPSVQVPEWDVPGKQAIRVYDRYQKALQAGGAVDFGDLIVRVIELFAKHPEIEERYASRFRYILVDEFQDTNPAQYALLRRLAKVHGNLCVVGDDDQSIYRWRGAEVSNILDFPRHFPGTKVIKLEQNYRSTGRILAAAHAVIEKNERRSEKKLWTALGEGEKIRVAILDDERDEAARVAQELQAEHARGTSYAEMAVFYRANAQSRALEDALRARRVPHRIVRGRSFYDRAEVKDVASYLRLCMNPRSDIDLLRIVNTPARGIGDTTVERLRASATRSGLSLWEAIRAMDEDPELAASAKAKLAPFRDLLSRLGDKVRAASGAAESIEIVLTDTGYQDRLRLEGPEGEDRLENLRELIGAAREFDTTWDLARRGELPAAAPARPALAPGALGSGEMPEEREPGDRPDVGAALAAAFGDFDLEENTEDLPATPLLGFLEQLALVGDADAGEGGERVSLMTLHAAKGLEFDAVWMTGLEERVFPSSRSLGQQGPNREATEDPEEMAEERRLCYVGMTRARKKLTLTLARCRSLFGELRFNPPSRFVQEVPEELATGLSALVGVEPRQSEGRWQRGWGGRREGSPSDSYEFDQRPREYPETSSFGVRGGGPPMPPRNAARGERVDPRAKPEKKQAAEGVLGLGPGARVRHPTFGVGTVEETDGLGDALKLTVRFPPGVGIKKVLARFVDKA